MLYKALSTVEVNSLVLAASFTPQRTEELSSINGVTIGNREFTKTTTATEKTLNKRLNEHVRYNSRYISLPSSARREMTKFCFVWRT